MGKIAGNGDKFDRSISELNKMYTDVKYFIITNIGTYFKFLVLAVEEKFLGQFSIFFAFPARFFLTKLFITFDRLNRSYRMIAWFKG